MTATGEPVRKDPQSKTITFQMPWVKLTKAAQAEPGARLRPPPPTAYVKRGRPASHVVKERQHVPGRGSVVFFMDGSAISLADAKYQGWLVLENAEP